MMTEQRPFDVVMVWYQNDWGLYGRRNEYLARTLLKHPAVRSVLHIEPPLDIDTLRFKLRGRSLDDNIHTNLRRLALYNDKGVSLLTPHVSGRVPEKGSLDLVAKQVKDAIEVCSMENILLWLYPPHPFAEFVLNLLKDRAGMVVSDCVDDHRLYAPTEEYRNIIEDRYARIVGQSDIVFCVSQVLRQAMSRFNSRSFFIPNAVSADIFDRGRKGAEPEEMARIPRPIIGYTGALSMRMDTDLLRYLAIERPDWSVVLIGTSPNAEVTALCDLPNVHRFGPVRHEDLHRYISRFDACILPHAVNTMTDHMNPLKVYEYLAHGKPVIATNVAGVRIFRNDIAIAHDRKAFVKALEEELAGDCDRRRERRMARVRTHTWTQRVDEMMSLALGTVNRKDDGGPATPYYSYDRPEVRALIPERATTILDVGCGTGRLGAAVKESRDCFVMGIELNPEMAHEARAVLDDVIVGSVDDKAGNLPAGYFDCIVLADVLEHLQDPGSVLRKLKLALKEHGTIVASIPNVRHWSVVKPLLEGRWNYEDAGILDRTHLRFFTKDSMIRLLTDAGYSPVEMRYSIIGDTAGDGQSLIRTLSKSGIDASALTEETNAYQYILSAERNIHVSVADTARDDDEARKRYAQVDEMLAKGLKDEAARMLEDMVYRYPHFGPAHNDLACLLFEKGEKHRALKYLEKAVTLDPAEISWRANLADLYCDLGRHMDAVGAWMKILIYRPDDIDVLNRLANTLYALGRFDEALGLFERVLGVDAANAEARQAVESIKGQAGRSAENAEAAAGAGAHSAEGQGTMPRKSSAGPSPDKALTSIIIPFIDGWEFTQVCLEAVTRYTNEKKTPYEIVLVDNGGATPILDRIAAWKRKYPRASVKYIRNGRNAGFGAGCNRGFDLAAGDYLVVLNNDVIVTPGWLDGLLEPLSATNTGGISGPATNYIAGRQLIADCPLGFADPSAMEFGRLASYAGAFTQAVKEEIEAVPGLVGFCMAMRRDVIDATGGFDEVFFPGNFEDDDLCLRARLLGYNLYFTKGVFVYHFGSRTFAATGLDYRRTMEENLARFTGKWGILGVASAESFLPAKEAILEGIVSRGVSEIPASQNRVPLHLSRIALPKKSLHKTITDLLKIDGLRNSSLMIVCEGVSPEAVRQEVETLHNGAIKARPWSISYAAGKAGADTDNPSHAVYRWTEVDGEKEPAFVVV